MTSNIVNVKKIMQNNSKYKISKRKYKDFNISKTAIQEEISYIEALIEVHMQIAMALAHKEGRKTIQEKHIIMANSIKNEDWIE